MKTSYENDGESEADMQCRNESEIDDVAEDTEWDIKSSNESEVYSISISYNEDNEREIRKSFDPISVQVANILIKEDEVELSYELYNDSDNISYEESEIRIIKCCFVSGFLMLLILSCILMSIPILLIEHQPKIVIPLIHRHDYCKSFSTKFQI